MQELVGKTVIKLLINKTKTVIKLLINKTKTAIKFETDDGWSFQDEDKIYVIKLITASGHIDIIFRKSSNGLIELCEYEKFLK